MPVVVADLGVLVVLFGALILCYMVVYFSKAFFGVTGTLLGKLPIIGGWIDSTAHDIERRITSVFGEAAAGVEVGIGATWHATARVLDWMGREIVSHAGLISLIATLINPIQTIGTLQRALHEARHLLGSLAGRVEGIGHDVIIRTRTIERGIGADVLPRIRGLERELHGEITRELPALRAGERAIDREITNLWKWTRTHALRAGTIAFAGAVALALARLGLGWLRCNSLSRIGRRLGCRGFGLLEDLLFGLIEVLVIADLCRITGVMVDVAESRPVQDALAGIISGIDDLLRCQGVRRPAVLDGYWTDPPPRQKFAALPRV